jgi:hypothetical protein
MKVTPYLLFGCMAVAAAWSCKRDHKQALPPEEVIRQYQALIDSNRYEEAKALCTPQEQLRLEGDAELMAMLPADSTLIRTVFLKIDCKEVARDVAHCDCLLEDQEGEYEAVFKLVKIDGVWRMDVPIGEDEENMNGPALPGAKPMSLPQKL